MRCLYPLISAKAGTQFCGRDIAALRFDLLIQRTMMRKHWVPAFAGMSGKGGASWSA